MKERDKFGVNLILSGTAALVGAALGGGPLVSAVAGMIPVLVDDVTARRQDSVVTCIEQACELQHMDAERLEAWVKTDDRHAAFFAQGVATVWTTLDQDKVRTLAHVLADGFSDDARLDIDQLILRSLRELEAGHIRILASLESQAEVEEDVLRNKLPQLAVALPALVAALQSEGCVNRSNVSAISRGALVVESHQAADGPTFQITTYGEQVLVFFRAAEAYLADL